MIQLPRNAPITETVLVAVLLLGAAGFLGTSPAAVSGGPAWAWGWNGYGQLGNGTTTDSSTPVAVSMPTGVTFTAIAAGLYFSLALDSSGHAWAWGSINGSSNPVAVTTPTGATFTAIAAAAYH